MSRASATVSLIVLLASTAFAQAGGAIRRLRHHTNAFYVEWAVTANQLLVGLPRSLEASYQFRF